MKCQHAVAMLFILCLTGTAIGAPPYQAVIKTQEATVRSGPGHDYYATSTLEKGETVEVYRRLGKTWCAIRPPAASYSWVLARDVEPTDSPDLMRITHSNAKSRVGSQLLDSSNVEYVSLHEGEIVKVIGAIQPMPGSSKLAYRIEPPAGEFRWIHQRYLELTGKSITPETQATGSGVSRVSFEGQASEDTSSETETTKRTFMSTVPIPGRGTEIQSKNSTGFESSLDASESETPPLAQFDSQELDLLSAKLSQMVANPVDEWNLGGLHAGIQRIVATSQDSAIRQQAVQLRNRLAEFDRLQRRHQLLSGEPASVSQASFERPSPQNKGGVIPWSIIPKLAKPLPNSREVPFEGEGWLIPVFTNRRDIPSYALTDDDGAILYFVTPRPGLNLRRYLRKRVGIVGSTMQTGPREQAQLIAQRVVMLDRHQR